MTWWWCSNKTALSSLNFLQQQLANWPSTLKDIFIQKFNNYKKKLSSTLLPIRRYSWPSCDLRFSLNEVLNPQSCDHKNIKMHRLPLLSSRRCITTESQLAVFLSKCNKSTSLSFFSLRDRNTKQKQRKQLG